MIEVNQNKTFWRCLDSMTTGKKRQYDNWKKEVNYNIMKYVNDKKKISDTIRIIKYGYTEISECF